MNEKNTAEKCIVCHEKQEDHSHLLSHLAKCHTRKTIIAASMIDQAHHQPKGAKA